MVGFSPCLPPVGELTSLKVGKNADLFWGDLTGETEKYGKEPLIIANQH